MAIIMEHFLEAKMIHIIGRLFAKAGIAAILAAGFAFALVPRATAQTATQLISTRVPGLPLPAGGNGDSEDPQISPDGRFVLFNSTAANLGTNFCGQLCPQVYLRDRNAGTTTLISVNTNGFGGNGASTYGAMTPDGRYVAFASDALDLVSADNNGFSDIFVRDTLLGTTVLASQSTAGGQFSAPSTQPVITPDGRYVAFIVAGSSVFRRDLSAQTTAGMQSNTAILNGIAETSTYGVGVDDFYITSLGISTNGQFVTFAAPTLIGSGPQNRMEVYVYDFAGSNLYWASSNADLAVHNSDGSTHPVISDDGTEVAFKASSPYAQPVFQYDVTSGALTSVYPFPDYSVVPPYGLDPYGPEMSPNGRFVVFTAQEQYSSSYGSVRLWDADAGTNFLISTNLSGVYSTNTLAEAASVSPDGRYVVFLSDATDLVTNSVSPGNHIYLNDRVTGITSLIDVDTNGAGSTDFSGAFPSMSTNGQFIAFSGPDGMLVPMDFNGADDVFVRNVPAGSNELISARNTSIPVRSGDLFSASGPLSVSGDGRWVAFSSYADDLAPGLTNNARNIFVCDRFSGSNILVNVAAYGGVALGGDLIQPVISANARYVAFASAATNLTIGNVYSNIPITTFSCAIFRPGSRPWSA